MSMEKEAEFSEPWKRLDGKIVMVTGASSGIGHDICIDLVKAGCYIIAAARRVDRLNSLCQELNGSGVRAVAVELDVMAEGQVIEAAVHKAWSAFGSIDVLINNAGIRGGTKSPIEVSEDEWKDVLRTNLTGSWLVAKYVCKCMCKVKQKGSIINISSISGLNRVQSHGEICYSASKVALNTMTKVMALEMGVHGIKVNSISPGIFESEITKGLMQKKWLNQLISRFVPLKTFGTKDPALTSLVRYLIHDSSTYVSGNVFIVDAGTSLLGLILSSSL